MAQKWDFEIQNRTKGKRSLDDSMRELLHRARKYQAVSDRKTILDVIGTEIKRDLNPEVHDWIDLGKTVMPGARDLGKCVQLKKIKKIQFDAGLDLVRTKSEKIVTGVRGGGPAVRAGLRNGDRVSGWDIQTGNPDEKMVLTILKDGAKKAIGYFPRGSEVSFPQYEEVSNCKE